MIATHDHSIRRAVNSRRSDDFFIDFDSRGRCNRVAKRAPARHFQHSVASDIARLMVAPPSGTTHHMSA